MKLKDRAIVVAVIACAVGTVHWWLLMLFWSHWTVHNPIANALLVPGKIVPYYRWILYPSDLLTSVLLSLPFGLVVAWLGARHFAAAVLAATAPYLAFVYWPGFALVLPFALPDLVLLSVLQLAIVPLASVVARAGLRRFAPNNSSKPTPLRGAA